MANHLSTAGLCPGAATIECCTPFGLALCDPSVPQNPNALLTMEEPGVGGCLPGMIPIGSGDGGFCIDQYEGTLVLLDGGAAWSPYENPGTTVVAERSVAGAVPQGYISGAQAQAACASSGKRLCTDAEWLRACQGPTHTTYPYGSTAQFGVCNDHRGEHPAIEYFGTSDSSIYSMLGNACLDQIPLTVDLTAALSGCVTAEGAYDMMGNLEEWTSDPAGTFRGGYFVDTTSNGPGCTYTTTAHDFTYWDYSTGLRCCAD